MSTTISSTTTTSSSTVYQTKQTPKLPDDFYETEYTTLEDLPAEASTETETSEDFDANLWGVLHIGGQTVRIGASGGVAYSVNPEAEDFLGEGKGFDLDWDNLDTPEEIADAIMSKYGGKLTASSVESGDKSLTSELMSKMFSSDALVDRMLMTSSGESLQEGLLSSDEEANGAQASASATSATSTPQVQSTAA
ncbi:hypothetical protein GOZ84_21295 [Agrobacterium vitis]|uniref:hypothetical protein n=1 Tax=Rhizobium/Agrobacterium group TaxID=227290 RepID=UPI0012E84D42|nr:MULTISPECIES: hypothetical protein [Rhizobium/Agrobacterium group]MCF1472990.1 hypothetical protein [Allorhizobium ampelinum]MVA53300.1 hypothetical protein [Agrobacterium vitis]